VIAEKTPNPEAIMFYPQGKDVLGKKAKTKTYTDRYAAGDSLLAISLFKIHGVGGILLGPRHVTVTKEADMEWEFLKPNVELVISQFFAAGLEPIKPEAIELIQDEETAKAASGSDGEDSMETEIMDLIEERVQPFVQQDGGDVQFEKMEKDAADGKFVVYLRMQGACAGCPKSAITLNIQIKQLIKHYFPEVKDVVEWLDPEAGGDESPRAPAGS